MSERVHELKCLNPYFQAIIDGTKAFEVRKNDRAYAVGDMLLLRETGTDGMFTGRSQEVCVTFVLADWNLGLVPGFVVLGIEPVHPAPETPQPTAPEIRREYTACVADIIRSEWYANQRDVHMDKAMAERLAGVALDAIGGDLFGVLSAARDLLAARDLDAIPLSAWSDRMDKAEARLDEACRAPLQRAVEDIRRERLEGAATQPTAPEDAVEEVWGVFYDATDRAACAHYTPPHGIHGTEATKAGIRAVLSAIGGRRVALEGALTHARSVVLHLSHTGHAVEREIADEVLKIVDAATALTPGPAEAAVRKLVEAAGDLLWAWDHAIEAAEAVNRIPVHMEELREARKALGGGED